jgi:GntR family transcriptional regulator, transcriptional repressor for pyruvate dehydrogenase complex
VENIAGRNTLVDDAADKIRQMIFSGQIKPGELLPPRKELAAHFGVGTSTIHEAVKSLDAVGLLESRPGKGTWVRHDALDSVIRPAIITNRFGQIDVETIYEARLMLEVSLAELAAQKATPEDIEAIWQAYHAAQSVIDDNEEFARQDWNFHMAVAKAGHNVLIETFYHLSRELLFDIIVEVIEKPTVKEEGSQFHQQLVEAIENHDVEAARQAAFKTMQHLKEKMGIG